MDKETQIRLQLEELKEVIEFGKFGFKGTLASGFAGVFLVLALAILDAFSDFVISGENLVLISLIFLTGTISFGFLSLRKLPVLKLDLKQGQLSLTTPVTETKAHNKSSNLTGEKDSPSS